MRDAGESALEEHLVGSKVWDETGDAQKGQVLLSSELRFLSWGYEDSPVVLKPVQ